MNSKSIKVRDGVKIFLDKAKSRSVSLHFGAIMTFDTDSYENNTVKVSEVEQSTDLPWSIPEDYDSNNEACLLRYGSAAEETLINSTRYNLDNEECVLMQKSKREEIRRMTGVNVDDFQVYDDGSVYEIFEQLLNSKSNINSYNVLCVMETYRSRPGYILIDLISNQ
ncbi:hypothetical protein FQA39_LY05041 [Lamprigera yunnana]|nr:hypothetical protein FQA39_LY05041 [Lamprigera yunnana]